MRQSLEEARNRRKRRSTCRKCGAALDPRPCRNVHFSRLARFSFRPLVLAAYICPGAARSAPIPMPKPIPRPLPRERPLGRPLSHSQSMGSPSDFSLIRSLPSSFSSDRSMSSLLSTSDDPRPRSALRIPRTRPVPTTVGPRSPALELRRWRARHPRPG